MPWVNVEAMSLHLAEISQAVSPGTIALLVIDGAGWHTSPKLTLPDNIGLLQLPAYAPELNPTENVWQYMRGNWFANSAWDTYDAIVDACCDAWNAFAAKPALIYSIGNREWTRASN
jgi:transposase